MIKILTINTWKCDGSYSSRMLALREELEKEMPDILLMQECFRTECGKYDTASYIAGAMGYNSVSSFSRIKPRIVDGRELVSSSDICTLAKFPIAGHWVLELPSSAADGGRHALITEIDTGNGIILIANMHLTHTRDAALRAAQLHYILEHASMQSCYAGIFACGDFNCTFGEAEEIINKHSKCCGAIEQAGLGSSAFTISAKNGQKRVDHIIKIGAGLLSFAGAYICMDKPSHEHGVKPSDHNAVAALIEHEADVLLVEYTGIAEEQYISYMCEWEAACERIHPSATVRDGQNFHEMQEKWENSKTDSVYAQGLVPATLYFLIDNAGKILGAIHYRHTLNDSLMLFGGHIGYGVRPTERNKGYASKMLRLLLIKLKADGCEKVLVTCNDSNTASAKTIEKNNGVLSGTAEHEGIAIRRYWIYL
jgi:predicted acetyltransferase/endonuclease/exonuclease/phosphatase family metal-dependent hydrolase